MSETVDKVETKFERWIKLYGVAEIVKQLGNRGLSTKVSLGMVYAWNRGEHEPRAAKRRVLLQLANGALTHEDIDAHFEAKSRK